MNRHKYRVVNPLRFFLFILISVLLITFASVTIFNRSNAEASSVNTYIQVEIQENDTIWSIAEDYCINTMDIRDYIIDICDTNGIDSNDTLEPGDVIFVPLY